MIESMKKKSTTRGWLEATVVLLVAIALVFGVIKMDRDHKTEENQTETTQMTETETETEETT